MPTLTLSIPHSSWAKLEQKAQREGITSVRLLCIYLISTAAAESDALKPPAPPEPAAA